MVDRERAPRQPTRVTSGLCATRRDPQSNTALLSPPIADAFREITRIPGPRTASRCRFSNLEQRGARTAARHCTCLTARRSALLPPAAAGQHRLAPVASASHRRWGGLTLESPCRPPRNQISYRPISVSTDGGMVINGLKLHVACGGWNHE